MRVKKTLADGNVVGIKIVMPVKSEWGNRVQGTSFAGFGQPFALQGDLSMIITEIKNSGFVFKVKNARTLKCDMNLDMWFAQDFTKWTFVTLKTFFYQITKF